MSPTPLKILLCVELIFHLTYSLEKYWFPPQLSLICFNQSLRSSLGPFPFTTNNGSAQCCWPYTTSTSLHPQTLKCSLEYVLKTVVAGWSGLSGHIHLCVSSDTKDTTVLVSTSIVSCWLLTITDTWIGEVDCNWGLTSYILCSHCYATYFLQYL